MSPPLPAPSPAPIPAPSHPTRFAANTSAPGSDFDPERWARVAGGLYLVIILLGMFGELAVRGTVVVPGDARATLNHIAASPGLWRAGIAGDLLMQVCDVPMIVIFYLLLRPVDRGVALFAALINLVQTAVLVANKLGLVLPLLLLDRTGSLGAIPVDQRAALALLAIDLHEQGFGIGLIFFAFTCLANGWLIFRSGFLPRFLGVLQGVAGASYLINSLALLLAPTLAALLFPWVLLPALAGELMPALWLTFKGVDGRRWKARRSSAL